MAADTVGSGLDVFFSEFATIHGGGMEKEPGAVRAFFRNGKFTNIVVQGGFDIPILRRTLIGHIQAITISTASHEVKVTVRDVMTRDLLVHPFVVVSLMVKLNGDDNYRRVGEILKVQGRQAGTYLGAEIQGIVESQVRSGLADLTSGDLLREGPSRLLSIQLSSVADGIVILERIKGIDWERSKAVTELITMTETLATIDTRHEIEELELNHQLELDRRSETQEIEFEHIRTDHTHQQAIEMARLEAVKEVATGFFSSGRGSTKDFRDLLGAITPPAAPLPPPTAYTPSGALSSALETSGRTAQSDRIEPDFPMLNMDARLKKIWKGLELPEGLVGAAAATTGETLGAVFVETGPEVIDQDSLRRLESELTSSYRVTDVRIIVLPLVGAIVRLVENYLAVAMRYVAESLERPVTGDVSMEVEVDDQSATVRLRGDAAPSVRKVLTDLNACLLTPIVTLLALDVIDVVVAD